MKKDREKWLEEMSCSERDVLEDEKGEFVFSESDNGSPAEEGYSVRINRVYLPNNLISHGF